MDLRFAVLPLLLSGCIFSVDSDDDGLTNRQERNLELDPENADTDGDGLLDGDEVDVHGTDPLDADSDDDGLSDGDEIASGADPFVADTDGDGYSDLSEFQVGSDPADERDVVYQGGWPHYPYKDDIGGQANGSFEVGRRVLRVGTMRDHFGDQVDLFDFYNEDGKPVIIDVSAAWCPPCQQVAAWLDGDDSQAAWMAPYTNVREAIDNGDAYWLTIMGEELDGSTATRSTVDNWHGSYPHEAVPVLADRDREHQTYSSLGAWPWMYGLNGELRLIAADGGQASTMVAVQAELGL